MAAAKVDAGIAGLAPVVADAIMAADYAGASVLSEVWNVDAKTPADHPVAKLPQQLAAMIVAADVDGDGDQDLVSANFNGDRLTVFYNAHKP